MVLAQNIDRWNRIESLEMNPHLHAQSMTKEARIYNEGKTVSTINGVGKTGWLHAKESNGQHSHTICKHKFIID